MYNRLCTAELIGLKVVIPTHSELSVEAFAFRVMSHAFLFCIVSCDPCRHSSVRKQIAQILRCG